MRFGDSSFAGSWDGHEQFFNRAETLSIISGRALEHFDERERTLVVTKSAASARRLRSTACAPTQRTGAPECELRNAGDRLELTLKA